VVPRQGPKGPLDGSGMLERLQMSSFTWLAQPGRSIHLGRRVVRFLILFQALGVRSEGIFCVAPAYRGPVGSWSDGCAHVVRDPLFCMHARGVRYQVYCEIDLHDSPGPRTPTGSQRTSEPSSLGVSVVADLVPMVYWNLLGLLVQALGRSPPMGGTLVPPESVFPVICTSNPRVRVCATCDVPGLSPLCAQAQTLQKFWQRRDRAHGRRPEGSSQRSSPSPWSPEGQSSAVPVYMLLSR